MHTTMLLAGYVHYFIILCFIDNHIANKFSDLNVNTHNYDFKSWSSSSQMDPDHACTMYYVSMGKFLADSPACNHQNFTLQIFQWYCY